MTLPRSTLISTDATRYYHCVSRCVRRAFLCGDDKLTGRSFEHRRAWIVRRLAVLSNSFAIDVCAYAAMANHLHLVVRLNPEEAAEWTPDEVLERWCHLFRGPFHVQRYRAGEALSPEALQDVLERIETYRARLCDLSWFMRSLNEPIARWANAEDGCTGRFWEGRFKCQALLDEQALLCCMAYVDLNPIRAGMAETPETSDFTSIKQRIHAWATPKRESLGDAIPMLLEFRSETASYKGLPFDNKEYLTLVDWSARVIHSHKRGAMPADVPPILERLGVAPAELTRYLSHADRGFYTVIGSASSIGEAVALLGRRFLKGVSAANRLFPQTT